MEVFGARELGALPTAGLPFGIRAVRCYVAWLLTVVTYQRSSRSIRLTHRVSRTRSVRLPGGYRYLAGLLILIREPILVLSHQHLFQMIEEFFSRFCLE